MFCKKCGNKLNGESIVCSNCGTKMDGLTMTERKESFTAINTRTIFRKLVRLFKWFFLIIVALIIIASVIAFIVNERERNLKKGVSILVKYDVAGCELNLPKKDNIITREELNVIYNKATIITDKTKILESLILSGFRIEGVDSNLVRDVIGAKKAIAVKIKNNTNKTLESVDYSIGVRKIGYSSDLSSYDLHSLTSDKILKPGEETSFCITKTLKDIDPEFSRSPEKFEFFVDGVYPEFY